MATATKRGIATRVAGHVAKKAASRALAAVRDSVRDTAGSAAGSLRERAATPLASRVRRLPIQLSIDVAVPVEVAWDEWMTLESLPEGMHRVEDIDRDGDDVLVGRLSGVKVDDYWEAEILDEREDESFAWRSSEGSDCAGLITFHRLSERLTRVELELDVIPSRMGEAAGLALHVADHRAERELRAFKARVEQISPDDYPPLDDEEADEEEEMDE
jgi:uncharacterized membrane protein